MKDFYDYDSTNFIAAILPDDIKIGHFCIIEEGVKIGRNVRIDNFVVIDGNVVIGDNVWIGNWTHLRPGVRIGNNSEVRDWCYISLNVQIGENTKICQKANVGQHIIIGSNCFISPGFSSANTKNIGYKRNIPDYEIEVPIIEDNVRIGTNVTILPGVIVRKECFIGGGAVVVKSTEAGGVYVGNPARKIKQVRREDMICK